jgi:tRNA A-37 threonylcarbamoyl transferase component Bud32
MSESVPDNSGTISPGQEPDGPARELARLWRAGQAPDLASFLAEVGPLSPASLASVLLVDQAERWRRGQRVPVESYARLPGVCLEDEAALDLIYAEFLLRQELGEAPQTEDYVRRFEHLGERLERLLRLERALFGQPAADTRSTVPPDLPGCPAPVPASVGKYRVVALLGTGRQAAVYRAVHPTLGKDVVIKLGHRRSLGVRSGRDRLAAEGRALAELDHPNLARVHDLDEHDGQPFLVLDYVSGRNLEQYARQEPITPRQAAALVAQAARALGAAHRRGLTHRDVKPENLIVDDSGRVRVIDFGLALLRDAWVEETPESGSVCGTAFFMAPEQARGEVHSVGPGSDVFALGGVLCFLLTGQAPFTGSTLSETLERARRCAWDPARLVEAGVPRRLRAVCERALAADLKDRYPGADDLASDLEACACGPRRKVWLATVGAALLSVLALVLATGPWWRPAESNGEVVRNSVLPTGPLLEVGVWRGERYVAVVDAVPVSTGDRLAVTAKLPAGQHVGLFQIGSDGKLTELARRAPGDSAALRYPRGREEATVLVGAAGTEVVLVCGRRSGPVSVAGLRSLLPAQGAWPALPAGSVLALSPAGPRVVQRERAFGPTVHQPDPEGQVRDLLATLGENLREHMDYFEALAFAHLAGSPPGK